MSVIRNKLLSALSVTRRLADHTRFGKMGLQRACMINQDNSTCWRSPDYNARMIHSTNEWITNKDEARELMAVWPDIVRDVTNVMNSDIPDVAKWMTKVLQYNVPTGKKTRALTIIYSYKLFASKDQITPENLRLVRILAWCMELLQAFLIMIDDVQDNSITRRNQACWFRHNDLGLAAINDALMLERMVYELLQKYFREKECYVNLLESFHYFSLTTVLGQSLDLLSTGFGQKPNLDLFTMDRYNSIVKYKTTYYSFIMPITVALHFAGIKDQEIFRQSKTIMLEMGHFFQVRDDYLDCYGNPEDTGKIGTDIAEGKCSWLVVVALQRVTPEQRKILEECYGSSDPEKIQRVKKLYNDLGLANMFAIYEEETYNLLTTHIQQSSRGLPHNLFLKILQKASTHKRGESEVIVDTLQAHIALKTKHLFLTKKFSEMHRFRDI